jgi:hypothetical protein
MVPSFLFLLYLFFSLLYFFSFSSPFCPFLETSCFCPFSFLHPPNTQREERFKSSFLLLFVSLLFPFFHRRENRGRGILFIKEGRKHKTHSTSAVGWRDGEELDPFLTCTEPRQRESLGFATAGLENSGKVMTIFCFVLFKKGTYAAK